MDAIKTLLEQQPLMTLFLTIAIGYLVGDLKLAGFSLGVGAVLFVALGVGWFAPKSVPAPTAGTLGLALFLATTTLPSATRLPIPSAWPGRSCCCTSPSRS